MNPFKNPKVGRAHLNTEKLFQEHLEIQEYKAVHHLAWGEDRETEVIQKKETELYQRVQGLHEDIRLDFQNEIQAYGPITDVVKDPEVTEICLNAQGEIYIEKSGKLLRLNKTFSCLESFENTIRKILQECGEKIDLSCATVDTNWLNFRLHCVGPPLCKKGYSMTLRRKSLHQFTLEDLANNSWCSEGQREHLEQLVKERQNVLVIGPTNTGKTTCINASLQKLSKLERVIFIEDTDELQVPNGASIKLMTREDPEAGLKTYDQKDLLRQSLRMRPDRIIIGEIRGDEAKDYIQALATGHRGSWSSLHAEKPRQALARLEMLVQMAAPQWDRQSVRELIFYGIDFIVCLENKEGHRRLSAIHKIASLESTGFCFDQVQ